MRSTPRPISAEPLSFCLAANAPRTCFVMILKFRRRDLLLRCQVPRAAGSVGFHATRRLSKARRHALDQHPLPRVSAADDIPVADRPAARSDAEDRLERDVPIEAAIEAEHELVEVRVDVLAAQAMVGAERPALEERERAVNPGSGMCPAMLVTTRGSCV